MKKIDKTKTFLDSIIFCVVSDFQNNGKTEIFHVVLNLDTNGTSSVSIEEIEKQLSNKYDLSKVVVTLIIESFNKGVIYRYNNYDDQTWYFHGKTLGFI